MFCTRPVILFVVVFFSILAIPQRAFSQSVSINTTGNAPDPSAMLHVEAADKGLIVPRVQLNDSTTAAPVTGPAEGLLIYNETGSEPKGLYYWDSASSTWIMVGDGAPDTYWDRDAANGWLFPSTLSDNVGVGDASPEGKLDVHGRTYIGGNGDVMNDNAPELDLTIDDDVTGSNTGFEVPGPDTLALYAGGNEQARIFPDGVMAVNAVPGAGTHTFYSQADAGGGDHAITGVVSGSGVAVFGQSLGGTGDAVVGLASNNSAYGVEGVNVANDGGGAFFRGNDFGAVAFADSVPGGTGFRGAGNGMASVVPEPGAGIAGFAKDIGAWGGADSIGGTGVVGVGNGLNSWVTPTQGVGVGGNGIDFGVFGKADSVPGGIGVLGIGNNISTFSTPPNSVGAGVAGNGTDRGVYGSADNSSSGIGVFGVGNDISSYTTPASGAGVGGVGSDIGVWGRAESSANSTWGGYFENGNTYAYVGGTDGGGTNYKIVGPGSDATVVEDESGNEVVMFATESPEVLFEDHGQGKLKDGKARIKLDPTWAKNVKIDEEHPLRVFVQVEGNCKGVYVTDKTKKGFTVKELQGGNSDVPFTYKVVANRKDAHMEFENGKVFKSKFEDVRFPDAKQPIGGEQEKSEEESGTRNESKNPSDGGLSDQNPVPESNELDR